MKEKNKKEDIAKTTILVLLILTIVLSIISTWYILDTITSVKEQYKAFPSVGYAKVSVGIIPRPNETQEIEEVSSITGNAIVKLEIIK